MADNKNYPDLHHIKEAICIDTNRVYDSCADKDCLTDLRVYLTDPEIVFFKNFSSKDGVESADFYIYNGKKASEISESVIVDSLEYGENGTAFVREKSDGELCIYSKNKLAEYDSEVYTILAY